MLDLTLSAQTPSDLRQEFGGTDFGDGLYRVMTEQGSIQAKRYLNTAFPELENRLDPFGVDWLGRIFSVRSDQKTIVLAEPGTAELLDIPLELFDFHKIELAHHSDAALAESFYMQWSTDQCVSYRKPLFLGGADVIDNLELSDMDVYWTLTSQMIAKLRHKS